MAWMGLLGGQVIKALDYRPRGPRFQPHYRNRDFFAPRSLLSSAQNSEKVYSEGVFTRSLHCILQRGCQAVRPGLLFTASLATLLVVSLIEIKATDSLGSLGVCFAQTDDLALCTCI